MVIIFLLRYNSTTTTVLQLSNFHYLTGNRDSAGNKIDTMMRSSMQKIRIWDLRTRVKYSEDRCLLHAFSQLHILKDKFGLSDTIVEKLHIHL